MSNLSTIENGADPQRQLMAERVSSSVAIDAASVVEDLQRRYPLEVTWPEGYQEHPAVERIEDDAQLTTEGERCPACNCSRAKPLYSIQGMEFRLVTCTDCGLGRLFPMPSPQQIASFYPSAYYGATGGKFEPLIEAFVRWSAARHARFLTKDLPPAARVLDVGCGRGVLLRPMVDRGLEAHGFEINGIAAQDADPRAEIRIADQLTAAAYPSDYFDQVILWHVLEHLPNPLETLDEIRRILRPGGRLVVSVPNFSSIQARWAGQNWFHLDLPRHLYHFPLSTLQALLDKCGFRCQTQRHFSLRQNPFGWIQSALNRHANLSRNSLYTLLHRGTQVTEAALDRRTRLRLKAACWVGLPIALGISLLAATARSGATVFVVAGANS